MIHKLRMVKWAVKSSCCIVNITIICIVNISIITIVHCADNYNYCLLLQVWEKKKKGAPAEIHEKSQEIFQVVEEVLSQESEDEDEEVDEEGRKELDELRKTEIDMKRLETLQKDISDIGGPDEDDISSLSSSQHGMKDVPDRRTWKIYAVVCCSGMMIFFAVRI